MSGRGGRWWCAPRRPVGATAILVAGLACLSLGGCATPNSPTTTAAGAGTAIQARLFPVAQRHPLPGITGHTSSGRPISLRDLAGRGVLVINVWASWCESCRDESAALAQLSRSLSARSVAFVGIDEQDTTSAARAFATSSGTTYPHLFDPDGKALRKLLLLPSLGIPSTLLVDRHGMMAARVIGSTTAPQLQSLINEVSTEP
jgi:peroxiredoxin